MKTIKVHVNAYEDLVEYYNPERLNLNLGDYILREIEHESLKEEIELEFLLDFDCGKREYKTIETMIRNYFELELKNNKTEKTHYYNKSMILVTFGTLLFLVSYFFDGFLMDILDLSAWVLLWEAIYHLVFEQYSMRIASKKYHSLLKANIKFERV